MAIGAAVAIPTTIFYGGTSEAKAALGAAAGVVIPGAIGYGLGWLVDHQVVEIDLEATRE
jgi:hypothetical protein